MSVTETLKQVAKNSNGKMIVEKVPASKQPSADTIIKLENEVNSMIKENDRIAYDSMHPELNHHSIRFHQNGIKNIEERYAKLLEGVNKEKLIPLPNPHESDIVTNIDEIDYVKDGFIARYCLGEVDNIIGSSDLEVKVKKKNK